MLKPNEKSSWLLQRYQLKQLPLHIQKIRQRMEKTQAEFPVIFVTNGNKEYQDDPDRFVNRLLDDISTLINYIERGE